MTVARVETLIRSLENRIDFRKHSIRSVKRKPVSAVDDESSIAVHQAHIEELRYAIEELHRLFLAS